MPNTRHIIDLPDSEREILRKIVSKGESSARTILRANILLASDKNNDKPMTMTEIARIFGTTVTTVENVRVAYTSKGLESTIYRKKRATPPRTPKVTGDTEARIIALACGEPPAGYSRWTLRLLASKSVELKYFESISHTTIARVLKKTASNRTKK